MNTEKQTFVQYIRSYFDIKGERENEYATIESLKNDIDFKGTKMWILICAIFIASLGLNTNSTAVIIGAMLISPLMGPIVGLGLGLGISDFDLVRRSIRNFLMATIFSILTSTFFFFISPISSVQSELLARTQPNIYDVLIAFVGGMAGIIAGATKSKGNVIPGVAIATALMPPLCTAGYGIGTGQPSFFFGAFYLYIINTVFIGLATFLGVRIMNYPHKTFVDKVREKRVNRMVLIIVICTIVPSVVLGYQLIQRNYYEESQVKFIKNEFQFDGTYLLSYETATHKDGNVLSVSLLGNELSEQTIAELRDKMGKYGLRNTTLVVRQGFGKADMAGLKSSIINDVKQDNSSIIKYQQIKIDSLEYQLASVQQLAQDFEQISRDMRLLYPEVRRATFGKVYHVSMDSLKRSQIVRINLYTNGNKLSPENRERLINWINDRLPSAEVEISSKE
ncbi:MAG: TIGR00341 family protein [Porphyromonas sp.]|nr:TIGR00341 family protein [Porphyromonas sp.]